MFLKVSSVYAIILVYICLYNKNIYIYILWFLRNVTVDEALHLQDRVNARPGEKYPIIVQDFDPKWLDLKDLESQDTLEKKFKLQTHIMFKQIQIRHTHTPWIV